MSVEAKASTSIPHAAQTVVEAKASTSIALSESRIPPFEFAQGGPEFIEGPNPETH